MAEALPEWMEAAGPNTHKLEPMQWQAPAPRVEMSWGELLDKISILQIKSERMTTAASIVNVQREIAHLNSVVAAAPELPFAVKCNRAALREINEKLWDLEDAIRAYEAQQRFDDHFVAIARRIYTLNDDRAKIKQEINRLLQSTLIEEKEYQVREPRQYAAFNARRP
jgi:hypothetical protein